MNEIEVRGAISQITGVDFQIREPDSIDRAHVGMTRWFVVCREVLDIGKVPYVNVVWADKHDRIWLESITIGDSLEWIEQHYGDRGLVGAQKMDLTDFPKPEVLEEFANRFPKVLRHLEKYEGILREASSKYGIHLEMRYQTSKERISLRLAATISENETSTRSQHVAIKGAVEAMKDVYDKISIYEAGIV
ncbi:MAG: hypothetical protein E6K99_04105 [Thaumarchaeota archaeon]|nr:MAG: hypothetical protein E6K99_04105 [Nitrososphaerota archaeon]